MAAVLCTTAEQAERARLSRERVAAATAGEVVTPVIERARFYLAEDYHQKYYLRHHALMREVATLAPHALTHSTLAARLNGFVGGHGTTALADELVATYGLGDRTRDQLRALRRGRT